MPDPYRKPYFDSSVFIENIRQNDPVRAPIANYVINEGIAGKYDIHISAWTLAEVHKKKGDGKEKLADDQDESILKYFERSCFKLVTVDREIGEHANRLCRQYRDQNLSPADAVHLACALRAECDVLIAWDPVLESIKHPGIRIEAPQIIQRKPIPKVPEPGVLNFEKDIEKPVAERTVTASDSNPKEAVQAVAAAATTEAKEDKKEDKKVEATGVEPASAALSSSKEAQADVLPKLDDAPKKPKP